MPIPWQSTRRNAVGYTKVQHPGTSIGPVGAPKLPIPVNVGAMTSFEPHQETQLWPESTPLLLPTAKQALMAGGPTRRTAVSVGLVAVPVISGVALRKHMKKNGKVTPVYIAWAAMSGAALAMLVFQRRQARRDSPALAEYRASL